MPSSVSSIEIIRRDLPRGGYRAVLFDFDGTLSLVRRNWQDVMIPMMVDVLKETGTKESEEDLHEIVEDFVMRLNGRQTIYQMIQLVEEIAKRGGAPKEPLEYKREYHGLLARRIEHRITALKERGAATRYPTEDPLKHPRTQGLVTRIREEVQDLLQLVDE